MEYESGIEELSYVINNNTEDLFHASSAMYDAIKIKVAFLIFVSYILLNTDMFAENILSKINNKCYDMSSDKITSSGIIISAMMLSLFYIIVDLLSNCGCI